MSYTTWTVQKTGIAGVGTVGTPLTYNAATAAGDNFVGDNKTHLVVKNTNGATRTLTITPKATFQGIALAAQTVVIPATTGEVHIYIDPVAFADGSNLIYLDWSAVSGVSFALVTH